MGMREQLDIDLGQVFDDWGVAVILTDPDGTIYPDVTGQIFNQATRMDPDTGQEIVVDYPHLTLQRSALTRVPVAGETWVVQVAVITGGTVETFLMDPTRPPENGKTVGYIKLYLQKAVQS